MIQNEESELLKQKQSNKVLTEEIKELKDSQSEYTDFMNFLNEVLINLGMHIELTIEGDSYYLRHTLEDVELSLNNISEGEKNLLALLYFYFELYYDKEQNNFKDTIKLIVIDDPISSLDDSNKFYVLEILKKILSEKNVQKFILTHSWDDFCQLTYGVKNDAKYGLFEIYKNSDNGYHSEIRECNNNVAPYKKLFKEIYHLSTKKTDELDDCDTYHAANSMRRIFEGFLNFKKPNLLPQKNNQKAIEDMYDKVVKGGMSNGMKNRLGSLLTFINVLSHRPIRSEEIITNSKTLMDLIKAMDKIHYNEMKV